MKKLLALLFVFVIITNTNIFAGEPKVDSLSAVLIDASNGRVLWGKDYEKPMAVASTTKIMTAIIALENCSIKETVTVSKNAVLAPKVKMNLKEGEEITLEQLLYALLMQSSNDAAVAIAEHVSGDVDTFCDKMNQKAKELGCRDTCFETPNGLDKGDHHSTAYDMAVIGAYAIKNDEFIRISNTMSVSFQTNKSVYNINNKNRLLGSYNGAIGIKTGFTGKAGHCFAGAAKRGDITLVSVVLASGWGQSGKAKKWSDTRKLLDYGFENYDIYSVEAEPVRLKVERSKDSETVAVPEKYVEILMKKDKSENAEIKNLVPDILTAPVKKGDILGSAEIYIDNTLVGKTKLIASEDIAENSFEINFDKIFKGWLELVC